MSGQRDVIITEVALRDGSHIMRHQYTVEQVARIAGRLDEALVPVIEVSHGDGLGGSSLQYGLSGTEEMKLIEAAVSVCRQATVAVLLIPGIGTIRELKEAADLGIGLVRVATHVTEGDVAGQHIHTAKELGLEAAGFLMMAHLAPVDELVRQARLMEESGADTVYIVDSAGALLPGQVRERVKALKAHTDVNIGFHGHNNLSLALANSLAAIEEGASRIDGSVRCLGAGAGNTQTEVLVAVLDRLGVQTGIDAYRIMDVAEDTVAPIMPFEQVIARDSLVMGYAGVYSSFLLHARRAAERFGVDSRDILLELGRMKVVGGQEDMIVDVAARIAAGRS